MQAPVQKNTVKISRSRNTIHSSAKRNRIRIIGGAWRTRLIEFPDVPDLRPTADRVRETLFNWLGQTLYGKKCLDLFAGSGALGFEALSRHAQHVTMVERQPSVHAALQSNAARLDARDLTLVCADASLYLRSCSHVFDVVFLDPPFKADMLDEILALLPAVLTHDAVVYVESYRELTEVAPHWKILKSSQAGKVFFGLIGSPEMGGS